MPHLGGLNGLCCGRRLNCRTVGGWGEESRWINSGAILIILDSEHQIGTLIKYPQMVVLAYSTQALHPGAGGEGGEDRIEVYIQITKCMFQKNDLAWLVRLVKTMQLDKHKQVPPSSYRVVRNVERNVNLDRGNLITIKTDNGKPYHWFSLVKGRVGGRWYASQGQEKETGEDLCHNQK